MENRICRPFACGLVAAVCCLGSYGASPAADSAFVAGFERFGRHGDIDIQPAGHLLLTELNCTACHATADARLAPKEGPDLSAVGSRLNSEWLEQFLKEPHSAKPGTTMPDMLSSLSDEQRTDAVTALLAFLTAQTAAFPEIKATGANPVPFEFWRRGDVEHGRTLFHRIGCVACHEADADYETADIKPSPSDQMLDQLDPEEIRELGLAAAARKVESVPYPDLARKYTSLSLTHFLLAPEKVRRTGRMPDLNLKAVEAADLAAYLLARTTNNNAAVSDESLSSPSENAHLIQTGQQMFQQLGCANCHSLKGRQPLLRARPLSQLTARSAEACFDNQTLKPGQPAYQLDDAQISAIKHALDHSLERRPMEPALQTQMTLLSLNCYGCHQRDQLGGVGRFRKPYFETVGHVDIGDEGRLPPTLTGVGRKLQTGWMNSVFQGKANIRPHLHVRMPRFPEAMTKTLPTLFRQADAPNRQLNEQQVFGNVNSPAMISNGRTLMDAGCVQCHSFKGETLPGTVGTDLQGIAQRIQPEWFQQFLLDPASLKPGTRMPTFFPGGRSQNPTVLNGNTQQQISAMWAYLRDLNRQPLPEKILVARAQDYELKPTDRPIILRTFMKHAGTHAIAVGFPQQTHFAFDAENVNLSQLWQGRFLDAEGTWFVRFAPPAEPLGEKLVSLAAGPALAAISSTQAPWPDSAEAADCQFKGYRIDKQGVPEFRYTTNNVLVTDRIVPDEERHIQRTLTLRLDGDVNEEGKLWLRAASSSQLNQIDDASCVTAEGVTISVVPVDGIGQATLRTSNGSQECVFPIRLQPGAELKIGITYAW